MLLLAGVLLVLGFVTIGSTLVQLEGLEAQTARQQRDSTVQDFRTVIQDVNNSIAAKVRLGEKDVDKFKQDSDVLTEAIKRVATRKGFYLDLRLAEDAGTSVYATPSRCPSFLPSTQGGVILAHDRESYLETIAGAVYDIYLTNGQESIEYRYYIEIYPCVQEDTYNYFKRATGIQGTVTGQANASAPDGVPPKPADDDTDGNQAMKLLEVTSQTGNTGFESAPDTTGPQWTDPGNIFVADDVYATTSQPNDRLNILSFDMELPPAGTVTSAVRIEVDQKVSNILNAQFQVILQNKSSLQEQAGLLQSGTSAESELTWTFLLDPGLGTWNLRDLENLTVIVESKKLLLTNPTWYVDQVRLNVTIQATPTSDGYYEVEWDYIPYVFDDPFVSHTLQYRYTESGTETWTLEVWDNVAKVWNARATLADTGVGVWAAGSYVLTANEMHLGTPMIRFQDSATYNEPAQSIEFDYIHILSEV